jgi:hypothetical protein
MCDLAEKAHIAMSPSSSQVRRAEKKWSRDSIKYDGLWCEARVRTIECAAALRVRQQSRELSRHMIHYSRFAFRDITDTKFGDFQPVLDFFLVD